LRELPGCSRPATHDAAKDAKAGLDDEAVEDASKASTSVREDGTCSRSTAHDAAEDAKAGLDDDGVGGVEDGPRSRSAAHGAAEDARAGLDASRAFESVREDGPSALPAAWRNPGEWVDLEFERAGLSSSPGAEKLLASPWGSEGLEHPDSSVLWPHPALSEHRSRPFSLPREFERTGVSTTDSADHEKAMRQLAQNRERLAALWRVSASHGISWDELDHAYVRFARAGKRRYDEWSRASYMGVPGIMAQHEKQLAREKASRYLSRFCPKGKDPAECFPSRHRRLTSRIYRQAKKLWFAPWRPGRLATQLQQLVAARMLRRETEERILHLGPHDISAGRG